MVIIVQKKNGLERIEIIRFINIKEGLWLKLILICLLLLTFMCGCNSSEMKEEYNFNGGNVRDELGFDYMIKTTKDFYNKQLMEEFSGFNVAFSKPVSKNDKKYINMDQIKQKSIQHFTIDINLAEKIGNTAYKSQWILFYLESDVCEVIKTENKDYFSVIRYNSGMLDEIPCNIAVDSTNGNVLNMVKD